MPNPATLGQTVTLKATVTGSGSVPTGLVTFYAGTQSLGSADLNGGAIAILSASTGSLPAGAYSVTATYAGDTNYASSTSAPYTVTLSKATPSVAASASPDTTTVGETVTVKATVTGVGPTPTGSVNFLYGGVPFASASLSSGSATYAASTAALSAGSYGFTASYAGDANYNSATSSPSTVTLNRASTTITLVAAPNPVSLPSDCTLTATIKRSNAGATGTPTGTVSFYDGTLLLGSAQVSGAGVAKLVASTAGLATGTYAVNAAYSGDASDDASTSANVNVTVRPAPDYVYTLNSNLNSNEVGNISGYQETSTSGELTLLGDSPYTTGLNSPLTLAVDAPMKMVFTTGAAGGNQSVGDIEAFAINDATGSLTAAASTTPTYSSTNLTVGPSGKYLYVSNDYNYTISAYSVGANGSLTEIAGSPFTLPAANCGLFCYTSVNAAYYDAQDTTLYVTSESGFIVATFTVDPSTGALTWVYNTPTHYGPNAVVADPSGKFLYVTNGGGSEDVSAYTITPNAMSGGNPEPLTPVPGQPFSAGSVPNSIVAEPSGKFVYVNNSGDNTISAYQIDASSGALTQITGSPFSITGGTSSPAQLAVDPTGHYLYVANQAYNGGSVGGVVAFSINSTTGALTQIANSPFSPGNNANAPMSIGVYQP